MGFELTEREKEVAVLLTQGYKNREIADLLSISIHTVKAHIESIYDEIGISNRVLAAIILVQSETIPLPEEQLLSLKTNK